MAFVCAPCHTQRYERPGRDVHFWFASRGRCEHCGEVRDCFDCGCTVVERRRVQPDYAAADRAIYDLGVALKTMERTAGWIPDTSLFDTYARMLDQIATGVQAHRERSIHEEQRKHPRMLLSPDGTITKLED